MTPYAVWTKPRLEKLEALVKSGLPKREVAKAMGLTIKQVEKAAHKRGWYFTRQQVIAAPEQDFSDLWQWLLYKLPTPTRSHA